MFGKPIPTNTTSPSCSSRDATAVIISSGVYDSEPVIHSGAELLPRFERLRQGRLHRHILAAIAHAIDEFVQIALQRRGVTGDAFPLHVEIVVPVIVALRVGWVRPPRLVDHRTHD